MRLIRLDLENWCTHPALSVDLGRSLQIEGRNGTGKSSILEAVRFVFRETARGYANRVRNGERSATVRLTFENDGVEYVVEKKVSVDKASSASMLADGVLVADNPSSVYERLQAILPEDVFEKLLYIPQGELTSVLERLSGKDGKLEMDRLFGLDRLELVWEGAGEEVQESEKDLSRIEGELGAYPQNAGDYLSQKISSLEKSTDDARQKIQAKTGELASADLQFKASAIELEELQAAKKAIDSFKAQANKLMVEEAGLGKEIEAVKDRLARLAGMKEELDALSAAKAGLEKYAKIRDILYELKMADESLRMASDVKAKKEALARLAADVAAKGEAEKASIEAKKMLRQAEADLDGHEAQIGHLNEHLNGLNTLDGHAKCPRCGQKLNAFTIEREDTESKAQLASLKEGRIAKAAKVKSAELSAIAAEERLDALKAQEANARHLARQIEEDEAKAAILSTTREKLSERLAALDYGGESAQEVEARCGELNRIDGKIQSLSKEAADAPTLLNRKDVLSKKAASLKGMLEGISGRLTALKYSEERERSLTLERNSLSDARYRLDSEIKIIQAGMGRECGELDEARKKLEEYGNLQDRCLEARRKLGLLKAARDFFHRDKGIVKHLRETFIQALNAMLTSHFKRFNQNPKYVDVSFDRDYRIIVRTTDGSLDAAQLSGGELAQLALALRIALIDVMSPIRLLIMDEPFGSLDEAHREVLGESLNKIAEQGQLILVTHVHTESLQLQNRLELGGY